jgi:enediyne biosynthesis protein E7
MPAAVTRGAPPGPTGYPLLGVFPRARRDPLGFFSDCVRRYGDVVALRLGSHHVYLLRHPDHVKHVLQVRALAYAKGPTVARARPLFGESLTTVDSDRWRERRRHVQPAFQPGLHAHFASVVARAVAELLERWTPLAARGEPLELAGEMRRLVVSRLTWKMVAGQPPRPSQRGDDGWPQLRHARRLGGRSRGVKASPRAVAGSFRDGLHP